MKLVYGTVALFLFTGTVLAQEPAAGNVTVTNKCCSMWDYLGVQQIGSFVDQNVVKTRLGQAVATALSPIARALGLGPSLLSDKFAKEGGVMGLAHELKKEEKKVPLKIRAIKYLGTLDCQCYPEVVDTLLVSLDDCSEKVRFEALQALEGKCGEKKCLLFHHASRSSCTTCDPCNGGGCPECDCSGCMCQKKVVDRLNQLLLARDEFGCLTEKSPRIRQLATKMIEDCLIRHQPHPGVMATEGWDATPTIVPDSAAPEEALVPESETTTGWYDVRGFLPKWFSKPAEKVEEVELIESVHEPIPAELPRSSQGLEPIELPKIESHSVGFRGFPPVGEKIPVATAPAAAGERIIIAPPENTWHGERKGTRIGKLFGY